LNSSSLAGENMHKKYFLQQRMKLNGNPLKKNSSFALLLDTTAGEKRTA
jgi:hypothetical protein